MNTSKKFNHNNLNEGESPEENNILDDLQVLVNAWREDNVGNISPIVSLQQLIDDYYSKPLNERVGGDEEWHTKEQGDFFTLSGSENLGNTDYFKDDGFDIIHQSAEDYHLSDISPESDETYIPKGSKKVKKTVLKPRLDKGPFNVSMLDEQHTEGDYVLGNETQVYDYEEKRHIPNTNKITKERFFQLVNSLAHNNTLNSLQDILTEPDMEPAFEEILTSSAKLYGVSFEELGSGWYADSLGFKILWATVDNYNELVNKSINNFDLLKLRPVKTYLAELQEYKVEHVTYYWRVEIKAYDKEQASQFIWSDEEGHYEYWEWDNEPGFEKEYGDSDSNGKEVLDLWEKDSGTDDALKEQVENSDKPNPNTINKIDVAIMSHIVRDNSIAELKELVNTDPYSPSDNIIGIVKLYGLPPNSNRTHIRTKKLIQFIWDNPGIDYKQTIGVELPPMINYSFTKAFEEREYASKEATVDIADTNFTSALCTAKEDFWDYGPETEHIEYIDSEMEGDEHWATIMSDGVLVWNDNDYAGGNSVGMDTQYNPHNNDSCSAKI